MCVKGFLVFGFGPGLDSMFPARSWRCASHAAGSHDWLPKKNGGGRASGEVDTICTPPSTAAHQPRTQAVSVWCTMYVLYK